MEGRQQTHITGHRQRMQGIAAHLVIVRADNIQLAYTVSLVYPNPGLEISDNPQTTFATTPKSIINVATGQPPPFVDSDGTVTPLCVSLLDSFDFSNPRPSFLAPWWIVFRYMLMVDDCFWTT